ncbi:hypothetical protein HDE_13012 [Halotydeus destructor]|nr:hypothetical protein HDE_13012 [Halotydeus destructor]
MTRNMDQSDDCVNERFQRQKRDALPTVTVRGFLNFRTTVDGTVIVFTPASAAPSAGSSASAEKVTPVTTSAAHMVRSTPVVSLQAPVTSVKPTMPTSSQGVVSSAKPSSSSMIKPSTPSSSSTVYPTGLVTVMADTVVKDGATTVHATSVMGTFIDGKYAQILRSTSKVTPALVASLAEGLLMTDNVPTRTFAGFNFPTATAAAPSVDLTKNEKPKSLFDGGNNAIQSTFRTTSGRLTAESARTHVRRERPLRLPWEKKKDPVTPAPTVATTERSRIRRPARPGATGRPGRFSWTPKQTDRVPLNRFKVVAKLTHKDKQEEEAARGLNARLARRLGITKPPPEMTSPTTPAPSTSAEDARFAVYNAPLLEGIISGDFNLEALSRPDPDGEPPLVDPNRVVKEVQTVTSEVTRDTGGSMRVDTVTYTTTVARTLDPLEPYPTDGIIGSTVVSDGNDLDALTIQETPPIVITRTYSLTESSSRTSLLPLFDGQQTVTHTVTENFVIRKLITAYKTVPPGDPLLLETIMSNMNDTNYLENLTEAEHVTQAAILPEPTATSAMSLQTSLRPSFGPSVDLNNPYVLNAALQNPALAAMYFGLQQIGQQLNQLTTVDKPTEYLTTETVYNTKVISFYDGRQTRTRTLTEPGSTIARTVTTTVPEVSSVVNPQLLVQQAQLQRVFASQLSSVLGSNAPMAHTQSPSLPTNPYHNYQQQQQNNQANNPFNQFNQNQFNQNQFNPNQYNGNPFNQNPFGQQQQNQFAVQPNPIQPSTVTSLVTTVTMTTSTNSKIYTLVYNALSTKYRTVTSTSVFPTTVTTVVTQTISATNNPFAFFG